MSPPNITRTDKQVALFQQALGLRNQQDFRSTVTRSDFLRGRRLGWTTKIVLIAMANVLHCKKSLVVVNSHEDIRRVRTLAGLFATKMGWTNPFLIGDPGHSIEFVTVDVASFYLRQSHTQTRQLLFDNSVPQRDVEKIVRRFKGHEAVYLGYVDPEGLME